jgi:hypothetical protein
MGVRSQNCNSASHQPRNLSLDRDCIDRNVLRRGRVCRVVHCCTVTWSLSSGCRPLEEAWPRYQNTTFIYILLRSSCTLYTYCTNRMNTTTMFWLHSIDIMVNTCPMAVRSHQMLNGPKGMYAAEMLLKQWLLYRRSRCIQQWHGFTEIAKCYLTWCGNLYICALVSL